MPSIVPSSTSQSVRQLSGRLEAAPTDTLTSPCSVPENSSGENWLSDELVWPQEIPTEKDLLLCGEGAMISMCSFVEKGSTLRILTEGASIGLGELSGQSVLKLGENKGLRINMYASPTFFFKDLLIYLKIREREK